MFLVGKIVDFWWSHCSSSADQWHTRPLERTPKAPMWHWQHRISGKLVHSVQPHRSCDWCCYGRSGSSECSAHEWDLQQSRSVKNILLRYSLFSHISSSHSQPLHLWIKLHSALSSYVKLSRSYLANKLEQ